MADWKHLRKQLQWEGKITTKEAILAAVLGAVLGGSGIVGLAFAYIRHFIDKRLAEKAQEEARHHDIRIRRMLIEEEWQHAVGRLFYHIHKFIDTGFHNGDLENAWEVFQAVEQKKKALDREIIVENETHE